MRSASAALVANASYPAPVQSQTYQYSAVQVAPYTWKKQASRPRSPHLSRTGGACCQKTSGRRTARASDQSAIVNAPRTTAAHGRPSMVREIFNAVHKCRAAVPQRKVIRGGAWPRSNVQRCSANGNKTHGPQDDAKPRSDAADTRHTTQTRKSTARAKPLRLAVARVPRTRLGAVRAVWCGALPQTLTSMSWQSPDGV